MIHSRVERSSLMLFSCRRTRSDRCSTSLPHGGDVGGVAERAPVGGVLEGAQVDGRRHVAEVADLRVQALEAGLHPEAVLLDLGADVVAAGGPVDGLLGQLDGVVDRGHQAVQQRERLALRSSSSMRIDEDSRCSTRLMRVTTSSKAISS